MIIDFKLEQLENMSRLDLKTKFTKEDLIGIVEKLVQEKVEIRTELTRIRDYIKKYLKED